MLAGWAGADIGRPNNATIVNRDAQQAVLLEQRFTVIMIARMLAGKSSGFWIEVENPCPFRDSITKREF
jgi:hypothetical protein